jgi:SAM-dependent methyltransferase
MTGPLIFTPEYYARMRALEEGSWWNAAMRDVAAALLRDAGLPPGGIALDVGCGSGQTMRWFHETFPGWWGSGCDIAPDGLRAARALALPVVAASAMELPYGDAMAGVVLSLDVLQHLPLGGGALEALREMRRVLRPGGWLLLRTNAQAFPRTPDDPQFNFHRYQPDELRAKLVAAGFRVVRLSRLNALGGLAEIPRELRSARRGGTAYRGILAEPPAAEGRRWLDRAKRAWLGVEGRLVRAGIRLPLGRTIVALCQRDATAISA